MEFNYVQMSIAIKIKQLLKDLKSRGDLIFTEKKIGRKANTKTLLKFQDLLPKDLLSFYQEMNGCSMSWEFLFEKQHRAHLHIPKLQDIKVRKANQLYIGDLQEEYFDLELIELDVHQNEGVVYLAPITQQIFIANHTKKNGLVMLATNFTSYIDLGIEYGFAWYWMEGSKEANQTKIRLNQEPILPPPLKKGVRILVVSEMFDMAFHGPGTIIDKDKRHFLVQLDYGAIFWFSRDEIEHFDYAHPYEVCKKQLTSKLSLDESIAIISAYLGKTHFTYGGNGRTKKEITIFLQKRSFLIAGLLSHYQFQDKMNTLIFLLEDCVKNDLKKLFTFTSAALFLILHDLALSKQTFKISELLSESHIIKLKTLLVKIDFKSFKNLENDVILEDFERNVKFFENIFTQDKMLIDYHLGGLKPKSKSDQILDSRYKEGYLIHWK